ncbi:hypothetical protein [Micromonospora sp. RTP1Z1]|uniref:hypothetical protein n=1 Tax=Micromonospora sp. RTP1Z1 TaxID=2994043 RepID=UPI0029C633EF|nr:hypothetical protein [Micromonospora sp. RTP1Z1]
MNAGSLAHQWGSKPPAVIALLADAVLGEGRDLAAVDDVYERMFADITADRATGSGSSPATRA